MANRRNTIQKDLVRNHMAAAVGRHIDTILKVAKILDVPVDIICR